MGLFGKFGARGLPAGRQGKTLVLLDVENGSIGSALVHLQPDQPLKLFGESRHQLRILPTRDSRALLEEIQRGVHTMVGHLADIAARLRQHESTEHIGRPARAAVYLGAPWGQPDLQTGSPSFVGDMREVVSRELMPLGNLEQSYFTQTGGVLGGVRRALPNEETYLLCIVGGEVTELLLVHNNVSTGYATLPLGTHTLVRTMRAHGFTDVEAHSAMRLRTEMDSDPMRAAQEHFVKQFEATVSPLLAHAPVKRIWVVSRGELGEWFARALSNSPEMASLFPHGGEVRVMRAAHVAPHVTSHQHEPDLLVGLHALHAEVV